MPDSLAQPQPFFPAMLDDGPRACVAYRTKLDIQTDQARARSFAWEVIKGQREDVALFLAEGLSMLSRGKAALLPSDTLVDLANALHDAVSDRVGQMERVLDDAKASVDAAHVDISDLNEFLRAEREGR